MPKVAPFPASAAVGSVKRRELRTARMSEHAIYLQTLRSGRRDSNPRPRATKPESRNSLNSDDTRSCRSRPVWRVTQDPSSSVGFRRFRYLPATSADMGSRLGWIVFVTRRTVEFSVIRSAP